MKNLSWAPLFIALFALPASADTAEDLDKWFRDGYAAVYEKDSWDHGEEFRQYFADVIVVRSNNGVSESNANSFVIDSLEGWRADGWLGTDVAALETKLLNASTVVFDVEWQDRNDDGTTENSCGWYLADKIDGKWLLSQYIPMACAD